MKRLLVALALVAATVISAQAGEKEELALKYNNIQLTLENLQYKSAELQKAAVEVKAQYDAIVKAEEDAKLKAATEKAGPGKKK